TAHVGGDTGPEARRGRRRLRPGRWSLSRILRGGWWCRRRRTGRCRDTRVPAFAGGIAGRSPRSIGPPPAMTRLVYGLVVVMGAAAVGLGGYRTARRRRRVRAPPRPPPGRPRPCRRA